MVFDLPYSGVKNRRVDIRLQLPNSGKAWISIVCLAGHSVQLNPGLIELQNISSKGCGFRSALHFPVTPQLLTRVEYQTEGGLLAGLGQLRWRVAAENGYLYGMRFLLNGEERLRIESLLNGMVLKLCPGQARIHSLYRSAAASYKRNRGSQG